MSRELLKRKCIELKRKLRGFVPFWDVFDWFFAGILSVMVLFGYFAFIETISIQGLAAAWTKFIENSGLLALLTAWTAIIGLYRLRHRPDKKRPAVREDFDNLDSEGPTDFGLRNFGPGPALYVQAFATIERDEEEGEENNGDDVDVVDETRLEVHESPIHLEEGDFASLVPDSKNSWVNKKAAEYDIDSPGDDTENKQENPLMLNLYYSYVSQTGARTPPHVSAERGDSNVEGDLIGPHADPRSIEFSRVVDAFNAES